MKRSAALISLIALLATPADAQRMGLSPAEWPSALRTRAEAREAAIYPQQRREVAGRAGIVSATMSPLAAQAGAAALREGGTAADAAVATALTQVTMMAGANVSFAGAVQLLYFDARTGRVYALDA